MNHYIPTTDEIEEVYQRYLKYPSTADQLFRTLYPYIAHVVTPFVKEGDYVDSHAVEDLTQDVLADLFEKGIESFQGTHAKFSTFCYAIAKNKACTYAKKRIAHRMENLDDLEEHLDQIKTDINQFRDPQIVYLIQESRLEMLKMFRRYIDQLMNYPAKPYMTVSYGFSDIVYHRYYPKSTAAASPTWAYEVLQDHRVREAGDALLQELWAWFQDNSFAWGPNYYDEMRQQENGCLIADMIFGELFDKKDFSNWSLRIRKDIRKALIEQEANGYETGSPSIGFGF